MEAVLHRVDFIRDFDARTLHGAVNANGYVAPVTAAATYVLCVFVVIPAVRPAKCGRLWTHLFAAWNLLLSGFSAIGVLVCVPYMYNVIQQNGIRWTMCDDKIMFDERGTQASCYGAVGFMMSLFMLSKFPELLDTLFLAYMRKGVGFLHWYHHVSVLIYCWFAYKNATPSAIFFGTMNYCVHAVMYFYFAASTYTRALSFLRLPITSLQLVQMFLGMAVTALTYHYTYSPEGCSATYADSGFFVFCGVMYASYFVLFAKLFVENYVWKKSKSSKAKRQ